MKTVMRLSYQAVIQAHFQMWHSRSTQTQIPIRRPLTHPYSQGNHFLPHLDWFGNKSSADSLSGGEKTYSKASDTRAGTWWVPADCVYSQSEYSYYSRLSVSSHTSMELLLQSHINILQLQSSWLWTADESADILQKWLKLTATRFIIWLKYFKKKTSDEPNVWKTLHSPRLFTLSIFWLVKAW